jgi:thioredoxin-related protein
LAAYVRTQKERDSTILEACRVSFLSRTKLIKRLPKTPKSTYSRRAKKAAMNSLHKRIELLANVAIIVVAILLGVVLVQRFFFAGTVQPSKQIAIGSKISLPGVEWDKNGKTLVLVLQKGCHYCSESAPFYQRLAQTTAAKGVKLIAVLPQSTDEGHEYLNTLSVPIIDIRQASLSSLNVSGTPTLILVNDKGEVAASWVGKLPSDKESEVLAQL